MVKFGMEMGPRYHFGGMKVAQGPEVCAKQDFGVILNGLGGEFRAHFRDLKDHWDDLGAILEPEGGHFGSRFASLSQHRFQARLVTFFVLIRGSFFGQF